MQGCREEFPVRQLTADEVLEEAEKDRVFMEESDGGVTFSGGEPLLQLPFLVEVCAALKDADFHVVVDTSGYAETSAFEQLNGVVDLFLYDLKIVDDESHRKYTGVSVLPILRNLDWLLVNRAAVWVRIPIVPGITDQRANLANICRILKGRESYVRLSLMPYHSGGSRKYRRLGLEDRLKEAEPPGRRRMDEISEFLKDSGFDVHIVAHIPRGPAALLVHTSRSDHRNQPLGFLQPRQTGCQPLPVL